MLLNACRSSTETRSVDQRLVSFGSLSISFGTSDAELLGHPAVPLVAMRVSSGVKGGNAYSSLLERR
jgi:hypothetical protein